LTLHRIENVLPPGHWPQPPADRVTLDYEDRHRRRVTLTGELGTRALLDMPQAVILRHGAGLQLEDGRIIEVMAKPEALSEVRAAGPASLLRLAWHIGNRHLSARIESDRIIIRRDHVIAAMLTGLGAQIVEIEGPFDPEGGAYDHTHTPHGAAHSHT
jgi:urease accessory protein